LTPIRKLYVCHECGTEQYDEGGKLTQGPGRDLYRARRIMRCERRTQCLDKHLPKLGMERVGVDDRAGATVSAAATISESRVCVWDRGICEAPRAKPPRAWHA